MAPTLYMNLASSPVRAVLVTAKSIGLELDEEKVNIFIGDQSKPEYTKINPRRTVPTLVDDGFILWDSHAIMTYLVSKYAKDDSLYPKDLQKRAVIDQRLYFAAGVILPKIRLFVSQIFSGKRKSFDEEDVKKIEGVYSILEASLEGKEWMTGDSLSLADFSILSGITSLDCFVPVDQKFLKLTSWLKRVDALPDAEVNRRGLEIFSEFVESRMKAV